MPLIKITIYKGKSNEELKNMCDTIKNVMKEVLEKKHDNFHFRIFEMDKTHMLLPSGATDNYTLLELDLFYGKPKTKKNRLYKKIESALTAFNIKQSDLIIIFREPLLENWYIRGQTGEEMKA